MNWVIVGCLIGSLTVSVVQIAVILRAIDNFRNAEARARADIAEFVTSAKEGEPSPLAVMADQLAIVLAGRIVQQVKQGISGISSGVTRADMAETAQAIAGQSPMMAIITSMLPRKYRKALLTNPQFAQQLNLIPPGGNGHAQGEVSSIRDRLQKGG